MGGVKIKKIAISGVALDNLERIRALQDYFYNREMQLTDEDLTEAEKQFLESQKTRFAGSALNVDPAQTDEPIKSAILNKLREMLPENRPVPVKNTYLGDKTHEEYSESPQQIAAPNLIPLLQRAGARLGKFGEQYVDNIPGLSSIGQVTGDDTDSAAGAAIQAGGRYLPLLGAAWLGLNAGPTAAGTLDDARARGYTQ